MAFRPQINKKNLKSDIFSGIVIALISIPISMGYAQIAGLSPVCGLYGSLLPILSYAFLSSSPQFVVGVDAMPAAMVGSLLSTCGIAHGSPEALKFVPVISLMVAVWFLLFRILKAGRVVKYISDPVMGGFISGVGTLIILFQLPKLYGGNASSGQLISVLINIVREFSNFNLLSFFLGFGTIAVILIFRKINPKIPMSVIMLGLGIIITVIFKIDRFGVKLLSSVQGGFPKLSIPNIFIIKDYKEYIPNCIVLSLMISLVVMAQTLLAANNYAAKHDYKIDNNQELIAYSVMNLASSISGSCPINGSVSRSAIVEQFECKSQLMSITAFFTMLIVLLFGTKFFIYLPVPVLTGIVVSALLSILDIKQAKRLWKCNKSELFIFITAYLGVLFLGTVYGVVIGVGLSFFSVVKKAVVPPRAFLGKIPGHHGYYDLRRNKNSRPIKNTVLYRFGGNLFFANVGTFISDIENGIKEDTKFVIIDAGGIGSVDITAVDKIIALYNKLSSRGIHFYLTEQQGHVNDLIRQFGGEKLINDGKVRRTISLALRTCGFTKPYPLEGLSEDFDYSYVESKEKLAEFEWAFGKEAESKMQELADELVVNLLQATQNISGNNFENINFEEIEAAISWGKIGLFDEEELLENLEAKLEHLEYEHKLSPERTKAFEILIERRKSVVQQKVMMLNPDAIKMLQERMEIVEQNLKRKYSTEENEEKNKHQ